MHELVQWILPHPLFDFAGRLAIGERSIGTSVAVLDRVWRRAVTSQMYQYLALTTDDSHGYRVTLQPARLGSGGGAGQPPSPRPDPATAQPCRRPRAPPPQWGKPAY